MTEATSSHTHHIETSYKNAQRHLNKYEMVAQYQSSKIIIRQTNSRFLTLVLVFFHHT